MSRLEELIAELCPDGVEYVAREQVLHRFFCVLSVTQASGLRNRKRKFTQISDYLSRIYGILRCILKMEMK